MPGIPVTHRGVTQDFSVVSAHLDPSQPGATVDWDGLARGTGTLVLLMAVAHLDAVAAELIKRGRDAATPVAVISDGTTPRQQVLTSTLGERGRRCAGGRRPAARGRGHRRRGPPPGACSPVRVAGAARMSRPALLAVAHGSRNPAAADVIGALARQIRRLAPMLDVRVAFIGHAEPSLPAQLGAAGSNAVVVPLLLSSGYHLTADITGAASSAGALVAGPLGPDELLLTALTARLAEAGVPDGTPVVLAAAGSSDPAAADDVRKQADLLAGRLGVPVLGAFATAAQPTVPEAVAELRERTGKAGRRGELPARAGLFPGSAQPQRR